MIRLYVDADVDPLVADRLLRWGHDALAARDAGRAGATDQEQLEFAAREGRTLLTFNTRDFVALYRIWWHEGRPHAGILTSRRYDRNEVGELLRLLEQVLASATPEDLHDRMRYLSEFDR